MLISDLEQLEPLTEDNLVGGILFLQFHPGGIYLADNDQVLVNEELSNGEIINQNFSSSGLTGTLSASLNSNGTSTFQTLSFVGVINGGGNFAFISSSSASV